MIHAAEPLDHPRNEVGWGRVPDSHRELMECADTVVKVLYQGEIQPGRYLSVPLPLTRVALQGMVKITATVCFHSKTDPQDPPNYTKSGIEIHFRPHSQRHNESENGVGTVKTKSFFSASDHYASEQELRRDQHKWETVLKTSKRFRSDSLYEPSFDIHYLAREAGGPSQSGELLKYAMVISIEAAKVGDLYNQVVRSYATILQQLRPRSEIGVST